MGSTASARSQHRRPGLGRPAGDQGVEVLAGDDVAVGRQVGVRRPGQLEGLAEGVGAEAVVAVTGGGELVGQAHVLELAHRAGGEPVAAGLLPGEALALDHGHVVAGRGQPVGGSAAGGAAPDHEHIGLARFARGGHTGQSTASRAHRYGIRGPDERRLGLLR